MQMKAPAFLVAEESFDLEAFFVAVPGFIRQVKVGDKINRFRVAFVPNGHDGDWAIDLQREQDLWDDDLVIGLNGQIT